MATARYMLPVAMLAAGLALGWIGATWRATPAQVANSRGTAPGSRSVTSPASAPSHSPGTVGSATGELRVLYWYDPMVPAQKFDKPGKSPFMDMQLVPRYADEAGQSADAGQSLAVSTRAQQALGMRLASVERRQVGETIEAVGTLLLNEREISIVQARTAGFVERTYARAPGDVVAAGAPLADLLNPEWLGAQQEYLAVRALGDAPLTAASRSRLSLLGMPAGLIDRVDQGGQPIALQTVTAPTGGVITELAVRN
ncbi:MAG: efflux RND transporter periplasmic adaptor subunit, partial [Burkholderiaceae bacterium]|nr:efflux RND transporter periplasmic adaptor subunit [Burkholderiaceae bacterium]